MRCHEIMRINVEHASADETVDVVAERMRENMLGCLPVVDDDGKVVGMITDRDIALRVCADRRSPTETRVEEVMTRGAITCRPDDAVSQAEDLMIAHHKYRVAITTDGDILVGIISLTDIAQHEEPLRTARVLRDVTARQFRFQGPKSVHPPSHRARLASQPDARSSDSQGTPRGAGSPRKGEG